MDQYLEERATADDRRERLRQRLQGAYAGVRQQERESTRVQGRWVSADAETTDRELLLNRGAVVDSLETIEVRNRELRVLPNGLRLNVPGNVNRVVPAPIMRLTKILGNSAVARAKSQSVHWSGASSATRADNSRPRVHNHSELGFVSFGVQVRDAGLEVNFDPVDGSLTLHSGNDGDAGYMRHAARHRVIIRGTPRAFFEYWAAGVETVKQSAYWLRREPRAGVGLYEMHVARGMMFAGSAPHVFTVAYGGLGHVFPSSAVTVIYYHKTLNFLRFNFPQSQMTSFRAFLTANAGGLSPTRSVLPTDGVNEWGVPSERPIVTASIKIGQNVFIFVPRVIQGAEFGAVTVLTIPDLLILALSCSVELAEALIFFGYLHKNSGHRILTDLNQFPDDRNQTAPLQPIDFVPILNQLEGPALDQFVSFLDAVGVNDAYAARRRGNLRLTPSLHPHPVSLNSDSNTLNLLYQLLGLRPAAYEP